MRLNGRRIRNGLGAAGLALLLGYALAACLALSPAEASAQAVRPPENAVTAAPMGQSPRDVDISRYKQTWHEIRRGVVGDVRIPDKREAVLVQATGQVWRSLRTGPVVTWGAWGLLAVIVLLAVYYVLRGPIKTQRGSSGRLVERFNGFERFVHWLTAATFVVLAITGLNILLGRWLFLSKPGEVTIGANFSAAQNFYAQLTHWGKMLHDYAAWGFLIGLTLTFLIWVRQNIPNKYDWIWLKKGGGLFSKNVHPPAKKFNAGQKLLFWIVVILGASLSFSGLCLLFPFQILPWNGTFGALNALGAGLPTNLLPVQEMQLSQLWHAIVALVLIAVILGHIYIGTIGMKGAFDAMGTGKVDENWAREHHNLWVEEIERETKEAAAATGRAQPAE
ncbi:MAG TPA: formate dehydrogenase subunit gamma [Alphaproteobacteria bacterium]|nr:formate dehydrogenase subunit gamma [Alphaproteobacteria bacterium]